jgi:NADPH-dependent 2,4-dienoyl-CoA reductase/sulfur reductase-like enzyme
VRIEHFVHAERMGQAVARNLLGADAPFTDVPFFWSAHYDVTIAYVGHAERWDRAEIRGSFEARDALVAYREGGAIRAVASIYRDHASLRAEDALRRSDAAALEALLS